MASGGVWSQGPLLGSWRVTESVVFSGLFVLLCVCVCSGRSQGDRKSRSLLCPQLLDWGHRPWVIHAGEPSHRRDYRETKANSAREGMEGRKGERRGRHRASKAVFLLETYCKLMNQGERAFVRACVWAAVTHRAPYWSRAPPPTTEGSQTTQLPARATREGLRVFKHSKGGNPQQYRSPEKPTTNINPG